MPNWVERRWQVLKKKRNIAHNQLYSKEALEIMISSKDIFFNTTPCWVKSDDYTKDLLGVERYSRQFPIGSVQRAGIPVTFGSDSLDEEISLNPFMGIHFCVTRGKTSDTIPPETEAISVEDAVKVYTINGAMQLGKGDMIGSITAEKYADFIVISQDIFKIPIDELKNTHVLETYFCGKKVFEIQK